MRPLLILALVLLPGLLTASTHADGQGGAYDITWFSIDAGGGSASGGAYHLDGTTGQHDAGPQSGGAYLLEGGFMVAFLGQPCPADTDGSGAVDVTDLLALLGAWGVCPSPCPPDINDDGDVNVSDLLALLGAWGGCP